ncbi:LysR family transcriptional regulator [Acidaminobacter sp. JC074]|uniref:LysR family transcriptional regulator n=1 Tax=Acidaminobacter sp. JC074 TaxID=2530199 RepID=UPI001F0F892C|nr:LysR family transcriptional regulator [Acidaminobacter sp. JC074]
MEIREIIYIKAIADFGNLTKASEFLHISQPSLSQSLRNTESKLGVDLFIRSKRGMQLTEHGKRFIEDSQQLVSNYHDFIGKIDQYKNQGITRHIGLYKLSYTTPINNIVMKFMAHHSEDNYMIKVESISDLERMLIEDKLDIAIIKYTPIQKKHDKLVYDILFRERLYVLLSKDHPLGSKKSIKLADLKGNRLISSAPQEYPHKMTEYILKQAGVDLDIQTQTNYENLSMIFDLVRQGFGITFASEYVCDYFKGDDVVKVALEKVYDYEVCAVRKEKDDKNNQLVDFLKTELI